MPAQSCFTWARSRTRLLQPHHRVALDALRALLLVSVLQSLLATATAAVQGLPSGR